MSNKRILLVLSNAPAPFGNAAARWYYVLLKGLSARGYRVTAFAASANPHETDEALRLFPAPEFDLRCYAFPQRNGLAAKWETFRRPHSYHFSAEMRRDVQAEMALGYDVLHCEQLWSGWLGIDAPDRTVVNVHYCFGIDCAHIRPTALPERLTAIRTRQAERYLFRRFPTICALTEPLADRIRTANPKARVEVIPLGIDAGLYPYTVRTPNPRNPVIGMIGSFDWQPTYLAGERLLCRLWPRIQANQPNARLMMVGRHVRTALAPLGRGRGIEFHENVPDIAPYFQALDAFVYGPSHGSGMKVKVLEAFGFGCPVVTTISGVEGLPVISGVHASIGATDEQLVGHTLELLQNPERAREQASAARTLLESYCDPQATVQRFADLYSTL